MKIAVPTNDGRTIGQNYRSSRGFHVSTVCSGRIVSSEIRWNLLSEMMTSEYGFLYNLSDCDAVIVNREDEEKRGQDVLRDVEFIRTERESIDHAMRDLMATIRITEPSPL
jgi:hypothetical protein